MRLILSETVFAIARLDPSSAVPDWGALFSITRTEDELSIICEEGLVPPEVQSQRDWRCLKVEGPLDFSLVGILASIAAPLARAEVPIFAVSTYDTDYILVHQANLDRAIDALERDGHAVGGLKA